MKYNKSIVNGIAKGRFALGGYPQSQTYPSLNMERKKRKIRGGERGV